MARDDPYATVEEYYRAKSPGNTPASDSDEYADALRDLKGISRYIDSVTGRPAGYNRDAADTPLARTYDPPPSRNRPPIGWAEAENPWLTGGFRRVLDIDDLVSVTSILVDENVDNSFSRTLNSDDYELLPRNAARELEPQPYRQIELTSWGTAPLWSFVAGQRVRVTGCWGWPAVPSAVVSATIELTALLRMETPRATNRVQEINVFTSTSRQAQSIITDLVASFRTAKVLL